MTIYFTSDQHFGHANIIRYSSRPFADVEAMNLALVERFNATVSPGDDVWHLGDFSLDEKYVARILPTLNGTHRLVAGNHDRCHAHHRKHQRMTQRYLEWGFASVEQRHVLPVAGMGPVLLTHMPRAEAADPRYQEYRPNDWGGWVFHGHVHERWKRKENQINVGVDQWDYRPVSLEELVSFALDAPSD